MPMITNGPITPNARTVLETLIRDITQAARGLARLHPGGDQATTLIEVQDRLRVWRQDLYDTIYNDQV